MFIGEWNKSVILTYVGMAFAVVGISRAFSGNVLMAYSCLIIAGVCDLFDGAVARKCKRTEAQKQFGIQLDSLVDVVSFLALPVTISIGMGMRRWYHILICGIARLAFFNVVSSADLVKYYRGLPVTYTALILPVIYLLKYCMPESVFLVVYAAVLVMIAGLNILDIKVVKPKGMAYVLFALLAIVMLVLFLVVLG